MTRRFPTTEAAATRLAAATSASARRAAHRRAAAAATVATAGLLEIKQRRRHLQQRAARRSPGSRARSTTSSGGGPQTILVLGSDRRFADIKAKNPVALGHDPARPAGPVARARPRSCRSRATSRSSIPRPRRRTRSTPPTRSAARSSRSRRSGACSTSRSTTSSTSTSAASAARSTGSAASTSTSTAATSTTTTRRSAAPATTRRSTSSPATRSSAVSDALDYVRYRHFDSDFVRAARQQDFLRQAKDQIGVGRIFGDRKELLRIFGRYTQTDIRGDHAAILRLLKLAFESSKQPGPRGPLPRRHRRPTLRDDHARRTSSATIARVPQREGARRARAGPRRADAASRRRSAGRRAARRAAAARPDPRQDRRPRTVAAASTASCLPGLLPALRGCRAASYRRRQPARLRHLRPRAPQLPRLPIVVNAGEHRPVLRRPGHELDGAADPRQPVRDAATCAGRKYELYFDGSRLRLVAWRTPRARLLGLQHPAADAHEPADARIARSLTRVGTLVGRGTNLRRLMSSRARTHRRHRHRLRRPRHRGRLRRARQRRLVHRHRRGQDRAPEARRDPDLRARPRGAGREATASACTSRPTSPTRSSTRGCCSSRSARRRRTRATPT